MVPPSPGIGFHRPMFRPYGSYGGFGSYGNPGFSSSIFSGLTSSLNNFANNYMKLGWATFGVNAGLNLLSVLFGGIQSGRTAAGRAGGAAGAGSAGRTPARDSKAILKDIQGCATLETFGSDDPESLKAEAKDEKDLRKTYLDNAKTTKIMKGSNPYTYSQLKADLANGNPEAQDVLDEVFGEKADNDPITAQELKTAIQRIKTRTTYNSKIDADQILNKLSDTSAKEAINQLDKCQEQYDAAVEAEKMAAKLGGNVTLSGKMETLRKELADSYSGISGTVDKLAQYQKEYNELSTKIGECKNNNKKERLQKKQNELAEKMKPLQKAVDEADEEIQKMRSNAGDIRIVRPQKAAPPQQPKDENSGGYTIDKDGNLCDKGGNKVDLTPDNLQKAGFELKDEAKGIWKKGDNYYKIDSGVLKPCNPDGTLITKPAENTNIPPKNSPTSPTRPTIPTTPEPPADQTVNPADDGGNTVTNKVPLTAKTGSSVVLTINGQKVSAKALGTHKGEDPNVYHVYVTNGGKVYYINEAEDGAKPRELKRDITTYDENGVKRYHINVKDNNKDDQMAKGSSMTISQYRDDGTLYTDQNYDNEESLDLTEDIKSTKIYFSKDNKQRSYIKNDYIYYANKKVIALDDIKIKGMHNYENICAAVAATEDLVEPFIQSRAITKFKGVEHRLEFVRSIDGVK